MTAVRLLCAVLAMAGCTTTFAKEATQPNPIAHPTETLRTSEKITIVTGDMDLEQPEEAGYSRSSMTASQAHNHRYPLLNEASFTMVSRDRLRFHVQVDHKWEDYADLKTWDVELIDDQGRHWIPESVDHARTNLITTMWDREQRTSICDHSGRNATGDCFNTIGFADDGWKRRQTLGSVSVFRGKADFSFYQRDLMNANVRWLKLVVKRSGEAFEFTWRFEDTVAAQ
jgi:hypothetical protein